MSANLLRGPVEIEGITMRPYSIRARMNCLALGLTLFTEAEGVQLTPLQIEEQVMALAWERSQPLNVVRKAIDSGTAWEAIDEFSDSLPPTAYVRIVSEINRVAEEMRKHAVEIVPRPGGEDKDAPGNS